MRVPTFGKVRCGLVALLLLVCCGCSSLEPRSETLPLHRTIAAVPPGTGCRVAVLPFLNDSDFPQGGVLAQKIFAAQLVRERGFLLVPEGEVVKSYQQLHLYPKEAPSLEQLRILADRLNAPLLITGIVMEMREGRGTHGAVNPQITLEVELRDPVSGEIVWTTFHRRRGTDYKKTMHFGTLHTVTGLCQRMAEEIINLWQKEGFSRCNE